MTQEPTRLDLDREIEDKIVALLARQIDDDPAIFLRLTEVYAAMRQVSMLTEICGTLADIDESIMEVALAVDPTLRSEDLEEEDENDNHGRT